MPTASRFVLDTHVWLWWVMGHGGIEPGTFRQLEAAVPHDGLLISAISVWEVGLLSAKGRLDLGGPAQAWVERALTVPGMTLCSLSPGIAVQSSHLPGAPHGDPADRIIMATALAESATLVTRDQAILAYAPIAGLSALPA